MVLQLKFKPKHLNLSTASTRAIVCSGLMREKYRWKVERSYVCMTRNQIEFWKLQEQHRSARANEEETNRHNLRTEGLTSQSNIESARHNRTTEGETHRANLAQEGIASRRNDLTSAANAETQRHNLATENVELLKVSNQDKALSESIRHNKASESAQNYANQTQRLNYAESVRSHKMNELINGANTVVNAADKLLFNVKGGSNVKTNQTRYITANVQGRQIKVPYAG